MKEREKERYKETNCHVTFATEMLMSTDQSALFHCDRETNLSVDSSGGNYLSCRVANYATNVSLGRREQLPPFYIKHVLYGLFGDRLSKYTVIFMLK